jgi:nicotinate phosphoribosyltransferase
MTGPSQLYRPPLGLLTDLYHLTMAAGYFRSGKADDEAVFHLHFRRNPFGGGFAVACGLADAVDFVRHFHFAPEDIDYLGEQRGSDGEPLFPRDFLGHLAALRLSCDLDAVAEGSMVFAHEPLVRVRGPLLQAQLLETPLLNLINFQTLIATKAARVCLAADGDPVIEFGLRRAQGIDGALSAARAAYVGGCAATSNVLAGRLHGIPVRGTHAHSWVMAFESEAEAFAAYAEALPNNGVFLVDTYDTLDGVRRAIEVGRRLRERGHEMVGIRLDSGDLAYLSIQARRLLDEAGFPGALILASNDLDEHVIASLKQQGARIGAWGVGTRLVTGWDEPALGGIYKLTAIRKRGEPWRPVIKVSEHAAKTSIPGVLQVRRFQAGGECIGDMIYDEELGVSAPAAMVDPADPMRRKAIPADAVHRDLLRPVFRRGELALALPGLEEIRRHVQQELATFHPGIKRFVNPHEYPVGLETRLHERRTELVLRVRGYA